MKLTLLELTQNILSAMNSDNVNSISDTVESLQVAEAIKTSYMNMLGKYDLPEHNQLIQLEPSNDPDSPVLMYVPDGTTRIEWVKYYDTNPLDGNELQIDQFGAYSHDVNTDLQNNAFGWSTTSVTSNTISVGTVTFQVSTGLTINVGDSFTALAQTNVWMQGTVISYTGSTLVVNSTSTQGSGTYSFWTISQEGAGNAGPGYRHVRILPFLDFIKMTSSFNPGDADVESLELTQDQFTTGEPGTFSFFYRVDKQPQYCCFLSNHYVIFDSYDNTQDTTLQKSKTMCMAWVQPTWTMSDTFVPALQDSQVALLLNEAKSLAFYEIKNQPHQKAEREMKRQETALQKWKAVADKPTYFEQLPNFGRRGRGGVSFERRFDGGI